jgi:hypothetical protein
MVTLVHFTVSLKYLLLHCSLIYSPGNYLHYLVPIGNISISLFKAVEFVPHFQTHNPPTTYTLSNVLQQEKQLYSNVSMFPLYFILFFTISGSWGHFNTQWINKKFPFLHDHLNIHSLFFWPSYSAVLIWHSVLQSHCDEISFPLRSIYLLSCYNQSWMKPLILWAKINLLSL